MANGSIINLTQLDGIPPEGTTIIFGNDTYPIQEIVLNNLKIKELTTDNGVIRYIGLNADGNIVQVEIEQLGQGIGLSLDGDGNIQLGDDVTLFYIDTPTTKDFFLSQTRVGLGSFLYSGYGVTGPNIADAGFAVTNNSTNLGSEISAKYDSGTSKASVKFQINSASGFTLLTIDQDNGFLVRDDIISTGFLYNANYFTNGSLNDRWIPDWGAVKGYVTDNSVGSGIGLSLDGDGNIQLGDGVTVDFSAKSGGFRNGYFSIDGSINNNYIDASFNTQNIEFTGGSTRNIQSLLQTAGLNVKADETRRVNSTLAEIVQFTQILTPTYTTSFIQQRTQNNDSILNLFMEKGNDTIGLFNGTGSGDSFFIRDQIRLKGIVYDANFFANGSLDDRWIPDWGAVKGYVAGEAVGAGAGLSIDGDGDIQLGKLTTGYFIDINRVNLDEFPFSLLYFGRSDSPNLDNHIQFVKAEDDYRFTSANSEIVDDVSRVNLIGNQLSPTNGSQTVSIYLGYSNNLTGITIEDFLGTGDVSFSVYDYIMSKGFVYEANYFTNGSLDDRWIPDWGAVKGYVPTWLEGQTGYNATAPQYFTHDASGNYLWVDII